MLVETMLRSMSSREYTRWKAFYLHSPFGAYRTDLNAALIAQTVSATIPRKKGKKVPGLETWMPTFNGPERQTPEEMQKTLLRAKGK